MWLGKSGDWVRILDLPFVTLRLWQMFDSYSASALIC